MRTPRKVLTVVGARPQFVKAAAVCRAIEASGDLNEVLVHTGQHFDTDMSHVFFDELGMPPPAYNLEVSGGGHGAMTGQMLIKIEEVMLNERPDFVMVYGDTNSTLAGALSAAKLQIPIVHVEAGLRSFNKGMPEEINRVMSDHVSDLLFCPTQTAVDNLRKEGIARGVHKVGDVMYDAALHSKAKADDGGALFQMLGIEKDGYNLCTIHRAENTDSYEILFEILSWLQCKVAETGKPVVLPLHPRTRQAVQKYELSLDGFLVIRPVGYLDMTRLLSGACEVYTDSGGVQKEAYFHQKPCITFRSETEWAETIDCGWNRLWKGPDYQPRREISEYGNGCAAELIVDIIKDYP